MKNTTPLFVSILIFFCLFANKGMAQKKGFEIGFQLNEYHQDFGLGLNVTTPYLIKEYVAIRLRANSQFLQHLDPKSLTETWTPYQNLSLGFFGHRAMIHEKIGLYGEGGILGIFPNDDFSKEDFVIGGYGLFGFEFYFVDQFSYFIEAGGVGSGAKADKLPTEPIYSNGFLINVGFRITFYKNNENE
ncbi:MAG: hypothetical protein RIC95_11890 [Vicingaceae bacterium]